MTAFVKAMLMSALAVGCLSLGGGAQQPSAPPAPPPPPVLPVPGVAPTIITTKDGTTRLIQGVGGDSYFSGEAVKAYTLAKGAEGGRLVFSTFAEDGKARALAQKIVDAKSDSEKDKLKEQLNEMLTKAFTERQAVHNKQIEALEAQLKKLKQMVAKREDNKREIIEERTKQLLNEAQGLGW